MEIVWVKGGPQGRGRLDKALVETMATPLCVWPDGEGNSTLWV